MNHLKTGNAFFAQGSYKSYKFLGQELQEAGFYDMNARFYMADLGRFGMHDPLSASTLDPYGYGYNNPVMFADPSGMEGESVNGGGGGPELAPNALGGANNPYPIQEIVLNSPMRAIASNPASVMPNSCVACYNGSSMASNISLPTPTIAPIPESFYKPVLSNGSAMMIGGAGDPLGIFDIGGLFLSNMEPENRYAAMGLSVLAAVALKKPGLAKAADLAAGWQGKGVYTGIDSWRNISLSEGKYIVGGLPGQSNYYTTLKGLQRSSLNKGSLWEGLQVQPHPTFGYRSEVGIYKVNSATKAAFGTTYANPQFGRGGLPQIFIPDYSNLRRCSKCVGHKI